MIQGALQSPATASEYKMCLRIHSICFYIYCCCWYWRTAATTQNVYRLKTHEFHKLIKF